MSIEIVSDNPYDTFNKMEFLSSMGYVSESLDKKKSKIKKLLERKLSKNEKKSYFLWLVILMILISL